MNNSIVPSPPQSIAPIAQAANQRASQQAFREYLTRKKPNTVNSIRFSIASFERFLLLRGITRRSMMSNPAAWQGITHGLVNDFRLWMVAKGYAIGTINNRLIAVKVFCGLAFRAGVLDEHEYLLIGLVKGYKASSEGLVIDKQRKDHKVATRIGSKKALPTSVKDDAVVRMTHQRLVKDTPKNRRNDLLACLAFHHLMRVGEAAPLTRENFELNKTRKKKGKIVHYGIVNFFREKINETQTHELTDDTYQAALAYFAKDAPQTGIIWRRARKNKDELGKQIREKSAKRSLQVWIKEIGAKEGLDLAFHDGRHYGATYEAHNGKNPYRLKNLGGWKNLTTPMKYLDKEEVANAGTARLKK